MGLEQPELDKYIVDNFDDKFKEIIENKDVEEILDLVKNHFTVDWYKRQSVLSKMKMSITGYYFVKCQSRDSAKQKAEQIMALLNRIVEEFILASNKRGE